MTSRPVYLHAAAAVTALGDDLESTWQALCNGRSAVTDCTRFSTKALHFHAAAATDWLTEVSRRGESALAALTRLTARQLSDVAPETAIIWAGVKGHVEWLQNPEQARRCDFPFHPRDYRTIVANELGLCGRGFEVNAACASSTAALALAAQMVASGEEESVLVCAADMVSAFIFKGFAALRALTPSVCRPFDACRDGLALGDGAAAVLLSSCKEGAQARLAGWGLSNDANHITGPARDGRGLIAAIQTALTEAACEPGQVEAFCAHGTGTVYNDAMELTALEAVCGKRPFPVFSAKGALGHTLGAAGALEAALCLRALRDRAVPPTIGLKTPEERALGRVDVAGQSFAGGNILTTNSGFGGVNAALLIEEVRP